MRDYAEKVLNYLDRREVQYADVRVIETRERHVSTKNGKMGTASSEESLGLGVRVLVNGSWGFASTDNLSADSLAHVAAQAVAIARASSLAKKADIVLAPEEKVVDHWSSPYHVDPFTTSVEQNLDLLLRADAEMRSVAGITLAEGSIEFRRRHQVFMNTAGSAIEQTRVVTGAGIVAYSYANDEIQVRSYPSSFGGQHQLKGYELVEQLRLVENARRIAEEAVALHKAEQCPQGKRTVILEGSQVGLQIHESIGHPIELDRVLGMEANYAGTSFLTLEKLRQLRYGSEIVNVVADARLEHGPGLGTFAYDDEGVPAQCTDIIQDGLFVGYLTSRETASAVGARRSNGTMRADGWNRIPMIRMTNVSLLPGSWKLDDIIADTDDGIYMETNRSWSIDDRRYHFQFGCEAAWEIRGGKKVRMLKNPSYSGITTEFWNSCDAICDAGHWVLWGTPNCGKGQPSQTMGTGHGAAPARFRNVTVGIAYAQQ
ncbi:MAG: TldD/PmbA family protein [Acidobacteria bacterium]|nr:TldD/PmbA family protein [Acidobacteriota bacterium]